MAMSFVNSSGPAWLPPDRYAHWVQRQRQEVALPVQCDRPAAKCRHSLHVTPEMLARRDIRLAMARQDVAGIYRILQKLGVSQRLIAATVGQSQSEISEILGGRHVYAYPLLTRIADGLQVPRGWMGLSYDTQTIDLLARLAAVSVNEG